MKRFLLLVFTITLLFIAGCESGNQGYGYSVKASQSVETKSVETHPVEAKKKSSYWDRYEAHTMHLYDVDGRHCSTINAYKGEYDGKKWYIFIGGDGKMTVVEDTSEK